jgi:hypothetical protein
VSSPGDSRAQDVEGTGERDLERDRVPTGFPHQEGHKGHQGLMVHSMHRHNYAPAIKNDTVQVLQMQLLAALWMIIFDHPVTRRAQTTLPLPPQPVPDLVTSEKKPLRLFRFSRRSQEERVGWWKN